MQLKTGTNVGAGVLSGIIAFALGYAVYKLLHQLNVLRLAGVERQVDRQEDDPCKDAHAN